MALVGYVNDAAYIARGHLKVCYDGVSRNTLMHKLLIWLVLAATIASAQTSTLPDAPTPQQSPTVVLTFDHPHHSWVRRHALAIELVGLGVAAGLILYKTWPQHCPNYVDGYPYAGTPPCPTSCDSWGCTWPSARRR